jgi:aldose 1-epimerase
MSNPPQLRFPLHGTPARKSKKTFSPHPSLGVEWLRLQETPRLRSKLPGRSADPEQFNGFPGWISMKLSLRVLAFVPYLLPLFASGAFVMTVPAQAVTEIGGQKVVTLSRTPVSTTKPEFTSVTVLPGRGMEVLQITANFPGKGNVNVLASPDLAESKKMLDEQDDANGDLGYRLGAAFLVPYPNRIRGKLSADGKTLTAEWMGHTLTLPANNMGKLPTAERHAMHGLILKAKTEDVSVEKVAGGEEVSGIIHAGDFGGHWLSSTDLVVTVRLTAEAVDATIVARNVGKENEPIAIAWHPYFNLPSGDRSQVRLRVPGTTVAEVDNYDNVFPTGKLLPVKGTRFDLQAAGGTPLGTTFFDDNWNHLQWNKGVVTVQVLDPAAHYGVEIEGLSPQIKAIQVYAPPDKQFVAVEHQFNYGDPFGKEWGSIDTGMVTLKPGESTKWHVRLKVLAM